jgi:hypothetical protein
MPRSTRRFVATASAALTGVVAVAAAAGATGSGTAGARAARASPLPQGSEPVKLNPADFTTRITNRYWPMRPGNRWVSRETDPNGTRQRVIVTVTRRTKRLANGITARVVNDVVTERGKLVEVTDDWYAQDKAGNVWYMGEFTKEFQNGRFKSTKGSFEAGVDGAQPGIAVPARPRPGLRYRQEYYRGHAEDRAKVVSVTEQAEVPFGHFRPVLMTRDVNPLEPKAVEFKFYARGVGPVLAVGVSGGSDREELVSFRRGR